MRGLVYADVEHIYGRLVQPIRTWKHKLIEGDVATAEEITWKLGLGHMGAFVLVDMTSNGLNFKVEEIVIRLKGNT